MPNSWVSYKAEVLQDVTTGKLGERHMGSLYYLAYFLCLFLFQNTEKNDGTIKTFLEKILKKAMFGPSCTALVTVCC
jgi:hypothetical protein